MEPCFSYIDQIGELPVSDHRITIESLNRGLDYIIQSDKDVSEPTEIRCLIKELTDLKNDLYSHLQGKLILEDKYDTEEFQKVKYDIRSTIGKVADTMIHFKEQQEKVNILEDKYHTALKDTDSSMTKISDFIDFLHVLDVKHNDIDSTDIVKSIKRLSESIKDSSQIKEIQGEYERELYILKYYLHHWIKPLNGGNIGNTCSMCLQRSVDTYLEPCGHTGCKGCIEKVKSDPQSDLYGNCFICRTRVLRTHNLYFS